MPLGIPVSYICTAGPESLRRRKQRSKAEVVSDAVDAAPAGAEGSNVTMSRLAIDFPAMPNTEDQHDQAFVFDLRNEPIVANAVPPKLPKL